MGILKFIQGKISATIANFKNSFTITKKELRRRIIIHAAAGVLFSAMFLYGFSTVYINSYNIMNKTPVTFREMFAEIFDT